MTPAGAIRQHMTKCGTAPASGVVDQRSRDGRLQWAEAFGADGRRYVYLVSSGDVLIFGSDRDVPE